MIIFSRIYQLLRSPEILVQSPGHQEVAGLGTCVSTCTSSLDMHIHSAFSSTSNSASGISVVADYTALKSSSFPLKIMDLRLSALHTPELFFSISSWQVEYLGTTWMRYIITITICRSQK